MTTARSNSVIAGPREKVTSTRVLLLAFVLTSLVSMLYLTCTAAGDGYAWGGVPLDDVWIHLVYSRSIAEGHPFAYNPGEQETGSTSPLWAILLAPGHWVGLPVAFAKLLSLLLTALAAWAGWRVARAIGEQRAGIAFAAAFPLMPYFAFAGVSGAEVSLFIFLMFVSIERALRSEWRVAGLATGAAILARPEGFLLLGAMALPIFLGILRQRNGRARSGGSLRALLEFVLPALLVIAPWVLYCLVATGKPLPATFYAKAHWFGPFSLSQFRSIGALLTSQPYFGFPFGAVPSAIGTVATVIGALAGLGLTVLGTWRCARRGNAPLILIAGFGWIFLYAVSLSTPIGEPLRADVPGSVRNFYFARYLLPGFAPILLVLCIGVVEFYRRLSSASSTSTSNPLQSAKRRRLALSLCTVLGLCVAVSATIGHAQSREIYSWNCQNVEELQVRTALWIAENVPPEASVGVSDAGALRYFGEHRIVDLAGLNSHRLQPLLHDLARSPSSSPEEAAIRERFWREEGPDCLAITVRWNLPLVRNMTFTHLTNFEIERNTICGGSEVVVVVRPELVVGESNQP